MELSARWRIQNVLISIFVCDNELQSIKCTKRATEIIREKLHREISLYHNDESMHSGMNETYNTLKEKLFYPKF